MVAVSPFAHKRGRVERGRARRRGRTRPAGGESRRRSEGELQAGEFPRRRVRAGGELQAEGERWGIGPESSVELAGAEVEGALGRSVSRRLRKTTGSPTEYPD